MLQHRVLFALQQTRKCSCNVVDAPFRMQYCNFYKSVHDLSDHWGDKPDVHSQTPVVNFTQCPTTPVMDVVFIVDSSSSIGSANFEIMRNFIIRMVEVFQVGPSVTQVGEGFRACSVCKSTFGIQRKDGAFWSFFSFQLFLKVFTMYCIRIALTSMTSRAEPGLGPDAFCTFGSRNI